MSRNGDTTGGRCGAKMPVGVAEDRQANSDH
jgi:hypothetical protein